MGEGGLTIPETRGHQMVSEWFLPWGPGFEKETGLRDPKQAETQETDSSGLGSCKTVGYQSGVPGPEALALPANVSELQILDLLEFADLLS